MSKKIFIDESGGTTINDLERFYVITAIVIDDQYEEEISHVVSDFWSKLSIKNIVKSSSVGRHIKRRIEILEEINTIMAKFKFIYYCLVIDKSNIPEDSPIQHKQIFYKYPHKLFYRNLLLNLNEYDVVIDKYGDEFFMESSTEYFQRELDCFRTHEFSSDAKHSILHLSDFIAGSYRRYFEGEDRKDAIEKINYPNTPFDIWPPLYLTNHRLAAGQNIDHIIASITIETIQEFIEKNCDDESDSVQKQIIVLNYLLYKFYINPALSIYRSELVKVLSNNGYVISEESLSTTILSTLRSKGIILMSTGSGVKIPVNIEDLNEWLNRAETQIIPYLKKVLLARNKIQMKANIDILDYYKSSEMKQILNSLKDAVLCD